MTLEEYEAMRKAKVAAVLSGKGSSGTETHHAWACTYVECDINKKKTNIYINVSILDLSAQTLICTAAVTPNA